MMYGGRTRFDDVWLISYLDSHIVVTIASSPGKHCT